MYAISLGRLFHSVERIFWQAERLQATSDGSETPSDAFLGTPDGSETRSDAFFGRLHGFEVCLDASEVMSDSFLLASDASERPLHGFVTRSDGCELASDDPGVPSADGTDQQVRGPSEQRSQRECSEPGQENSEDDTLLGRAVHRSNSEESTDGDVRRRDR